MIEAQKVSYAYEETEGAPALNDVTLTIREGEFVAVLGHNGSGKSTLAKHFNAIYTPSEGKIIVDGMNTAEEGLVFNIREKVGMVFQNPDNQMVASIIEDDVAFAPENLGVPQPEIVVRVTEALEAVGMTEYRKQAPHHLSGGQKQRIAIAGVLAMHPKYIVLDEPTAMLDPVGRREVMSALHKLNADGVAVILITHHMDEAVQADRVVVMNDGRVVTSGTPRQVFSDIELIKGIGLDVPQVTELLWELKKEGMAVRTDLLTVEEAYEELQRIMG